MNTVSASPLRRLLVALAVAAACAASPAALAFGGGHFYIKKNLVSDGSVPAGHTDPNLVNGWGIAFNPYGFSWVSANGTGTSTLYDGAGNPQSLVVQIPSRSGSSGGNPTGIVYNGSTSGFVVSKGTSSGASPFIFSTEDGLIAAWAPAVDFAHAIKVVDNSAKGAVYKGLALSAGGSGSLLYATDFHNRKIDVFDSNFKPVKLAAGAFADAAVPAKFAPFGIQAINGNIYVTYAKQDGDAHDDVKGPGLGLVNVFDPNGRLIQRIVSTASLARAKLNSPWGLALAPAGFGRFSNRLLVGNFGDGAITAFDLSTGQCVGQLKSADGNPIIVDGLWGIAFGNGFQNQPVNTLYYAAGPHDEQHGSYGRIAVDPASADGDADDFSANDCQ
jgi:uncharacterized protein (TIGR03118 family)